MSLITEEMRGKASEIYHENELCKAHFQRLMREVGLPSGLLPLEDVLECGYVRETGLVWMKQKKEVRHKFEKIGKLVSYATEVTAYVEQGKIKKVTGIKARELMVWLTVTEATADSLKGENIVFKTTTGLYRTFPRDAFEVQEGPVKERIHVERGGGGGRVEVANLV